MSLLEIAQMNLVELAQKVTKITGDTSLGRPFPTIRPDGVSSVTFQGSRGWYDVANLPNQGMIILFLEGQEEPTGKVIGSYYTQPQSADIEAAKLILHLVPELKPQGLVFQAGYMSWDPSGVNWKLFLVANEVELLFKSHREGVNTDCEMIVGSQVIGMKITSSGIVEDIRKITSSRL